MSAEVQSPTPIKARVLVVEDDRSSRSAMLALLRLAGFEALPAKNLAEGMVQLANGPDCLILDLMLPDGNGGAILAHIREHNLPIRVAVTTGTMEWQRMLQVSPGPPDAIFSKPLNFGEVVSWLRSNSRP